MKTDIHYVHSKYPSVPDLRDKAKTKIPKFAFEYLDGGCNDDVSLKRNTQRIREIELKPKYLVPYKSPDLNVNLFGEVYDSPFGIAPIGLQGLCGLKHQRFLQSSF